LFWFFGIHGSNVMAPVMSGVYLTALTENMNSWQANSSYADLPYQWTSGSWEAFVYLGGSGASIGLIIAIFIFSKRKEYRTIAALAAPMGVFEINEPMVFGLPIVLNPIFIIPWILVPPILAVIAWLATMSGIVPPTIIQLPWIAPPIIGAFIATGFQWTAAVLAAINLAISVAIWSIFVIMANGIAEKEAAAEAQLEAAATA
jgi:PTS system cellobiose-specific IIC component